MALYQLSYFLFTSNNFDMLTAIHKITEESNIACKWRHVKGHQDKYIGPLDRWVSLNFISNTAAKQQWEENQALSY